MSDNKESRKKWFHGWEPLVAIITAVGVAFSVGLSISSEIKEELKEEVKTKNEQIKQLEIDILDMGDLPSKIQSLTQENKSCNIKRNKLSTKLEIANSTNTTLENENVLLKEQIQKLKSDNVVSCSESANNEISSNIYGAEQFGESVEIIDVNNFQINLKKCSQNNDRVTCYLSVTNTGQKSSFGILAAGHSYVVSSNGNKISGKSTRIANSNESSSIYRVLHNGIKVPAYISFEGFPPVQEKIAVLVIYMAGSESTFRNVPLSD